MKIKYILWIFVVIGMISGECSDDSETLTPSDMEEWKPVLASGNNVYDEKIEDFYNRTGVYILYQFEPERCILTGRMHGRKSCGYDYNKSDLYSQWG
ncbi:MAG: hypothetical protein ACLU4J_09985 [Butyricimonas paravirosa]